MYRPYNTLFLLSSLDGRISTGIGNNMDFDKDLPGVVKGLGAYYEAEKSTDYWSMISGSVAMKLGADEGCFIKNFHECGHVLTDCYDLTERAIEHIAKGCKELILVTDITHRCYSRKVVTENMLVVCVSDMRNARDVMESLYACGVKSMTVQTGGRINSNLLRARVIDRVDLFIAPVIVGGVGVPTVADGRAISDVTRLSSLTALNLLSVKSYDGGLLRATYEVRGSLGDTDCLGYIV